MNKDEFYIEECIKLAKKGIGYVSPNPLVGCLIVKNNKIIGKGYHKLFGSTHAEVNAISDAKKKGFDVKASSLYINLEPCSHFGKTSPCTDLIMKEKIKNVFIGMKDPNPLVNGKGIKILKSKGIEVKFGILETECKDVNKFFIKYIGNKRPFITLKIAQSIDGKIALDNYKSKYISGIESQKFVHKLRSQYDGVLIGRNTALLDNPLLNVRYIKGRNPFRFVIDKDLTLPRNLNLFKDTSSNKTYTICSNKNKINIRDNRKYIFVPERNNKLHLKSIINELYKLNISSLLVEGGSNIYSQFIKENLFDDIYFIIASKIIGSGISPFKDFKVYSLSKSKNLNLQNIFLNKEDIILHYNK